MFQKLKKRLIFMYGFTTSLIITVILTGICILTFRQNQDYIKELFAKNVEQIADKILTENEIDKTWIIQMQEKNNLLIYIEDSGKELTNYNHSVATGTVQNYKNIIKELAAGEGISLDRPPLFARSEMTSVYHIGGNAIDSCYGMAYYLPKDNGWLSIIAVYYDDNGIASLMKVVFLYVLIDLFGILALFLISALYIGKVLKPLEEGQRKQNAFVAAASHELRSPLTVIKAGIFSIREDHSKADQFLPYIEGECNRMTRLIADMLTLASADSKTWSINCDKVDLTKLLIESYDIFCSLYKNNHLSLDLPDEQLHEIIGDDERIQQILTILVDNAISYSPEGGNIVIRAYNQKHYVCVEVEDHGIGISDEDKVLVFDRFYRVDKARKDKKHFGLGLSVAKELVQLHQGEISIKDTPGGGATLTIRFPGKNSDIFSPEKP